MEVSFGGAWGPNFFDVDGGDFGQIFVILAEGEETRRRKHPNAALPVLGERRVAHLGDLAGDVIAGKRNGLVEVKRVLSGDDEAVVEGARARKGVAAGVLASVHDVVVLGAEKLRGRRTSTKSSMASRGG